MPPPNWRPNGTTTQASALPPPRRPPRATPPPRFHANSTHTGLARVKTTTRPPPWQGAHRPNHYAAGRGAAGSGSGVPPLNILDHHGALPYPFRYLPVLDSRLSTSPVSHGRAEGGEAPGARKLGDRSWEIGAPRLPQADHGAHGAHGGGKLGDWEIFTTKPTTGDFLPRRTEDAEGEFFRGDAGTRRGGRRRWGRGTLRSSAPQREELPSFRAPPALPLNFPFPRPRTCAR